jgi:hypothetical protein
MNQQSFFCEPVVAIILHLETISAARVAALSRAGTATIAFACT